MFLIYCINVVKKRGSMIIKFELFKTVVITSLTPSPDNGRTLSMCSGVQEDKIYAFSI